ncbi:cytochrome c-type biogenesis protein CcmE homolog, mitochondrial-like [Humulus lupulus]|uniref:cytochrome c-type biogenesis protein CcmE homolog, mitochondrial-like n=1 Tax=Humulus lupulus TaxID=3486 RepID=UPI002B404FC0|nr:cytochrome c-type biogenesis protein CcmE homolog, mitochondrial-like [Humulus lupulus]
MVARLALRLRAHLLRATLTTTHIATTTVYRQPIFQSPPLILSRLPHHCSIPEDLSLGLRFLSTARRNPKRAKSVDIGARARQMQTRRLWLYALSFSCVAGFIVVVLNSFQDQLVFYVTPTEALDKFIVNPSKNKFRLGGLVLEGSVVHPASSPEIEFVVTDLITDILVRYQGALPDLFREGHSAVVEGFVKPITDEVRNEVSAKNVSEKARSGDCYFVATEVLAKHDEKYMPQQVASAIEKNKKKIEADKAAGVEFREA